MKQSSINSLIHFHTSVYKSLFIFFQYNLQKLFPLEKIFILCTSNRNKMYHNSHIREFHYLFPNLTLEMFLKCFLIFPEFEPQKNLSLKNTCIFLAYFKIIFQKRRNTFNIHFFVLIITNSLQLQCSIGNRNENKTVFWSLYKTGRFLRLCGHTMKRQKEFFQPKIFWSDFPLPSCIETEVLPSLALALCVPEMLSI